MIWGEFGLNVNFPGQVTDDKVYHPLQNFTNKIVSDMLLREIDQAPSICVSVDVIHWLHSPIEYFINNDRDQDIDAINFIFEMAIKTTAHATQIPLNVLTHGIAMRLKARNQKTSEDTSNVMFETPLELTQDISVIIRKQVQFTLNMLEIVINVGCIVTNAFLRLASKE